MHGFLTGMTTDGNTVVLLSKMDLKLVCNIAWMNIQSMSKMMIFLLLLYMKVIESYISYVTYGPCDNMVGHDMGHFNPNKLYFGDIQRILFISCFHRSHLNNTS